MILQLFATPPSCGAAPIGGFGHRIKKKTAARRKKGRTKKYKFVLCNTTRGLALPRIDPSTVRDTHVYLYCSLYVN